MLGGNKNYGKRRKAEQGLGVLGGQRWVAILSGMTRVDLTLKVTFEQRLQEDEGITHVNICGHMGKSVRGRGNSMCKDPKQGV